MSVSPPESMTAGESKDFELRWLRLAGYLAWIFPIAWLLVGGAIVARFSKELLLPLTIVPLWAMIAVAGAYYGHLALARFRPALPWIQGTAAACALASAAAWIAAGYEAGVTVLLSLFALVSFVWTWASPMAHFLCVQGRLARAGILALCFFFPFGWIGLVAGAYGLCVGLMAGEPFLAVFWLAVVLASLALVLLARLLSRRARAAARLFLEAAPGRPADSV